MNVNRISLPPSPLQTPAHAAPSAEKTFHDQLAQHATPVQKAASPQPDAILTDAEKEFFENLYPASVEAIRSYSPYHRDAATTSARVGTLVDRKG